MAKAITLTQGKDSDVAVLSNLPEGTVVTAATVVEQKPKRVRKPKDPEVVQLRNDFASLQNKCDCLTQEHTRAEKELAETQAHLASVYKKSCATQSDMLTYKAMLLNTREQLQALVTSIDILIRKEDNRHGT